MNRAIKGICIFGIIILVFTIIILIFMEEIKSNASDNDVYSLLIDVEDSKLYLLKNNVLEKTYKCSGGKASTPSPIGKWKIISKGKWGEGFGGSWMRNKCTMGKVWYTWDIK